MSTDFKTKTLEVAEILQGQLTWIESNAGFMEYFPHNTTENLKIEFKLMDFSCKATARLTAGVGKTLERCMDFYKRVLTTHNRCQTSAEKRMQEFPNHEEHLKYLQDRL